jgi:malonyl-CoA O-methyltransferase
MPPDSVPTIDKRWMRASFERAAASYDAVAVLQREVEARMLERLDFIRHEPKVILDLGCGTGTGTVALMKRYRRARLISLDIAHGMLKATRRRAPWLRKPGLVCADADFLPLADRSVDMIFSNLTLQWCQNLEHTFGELRRVLRPNGLLLFSTLGPDTLKELRSAWEQVDGHSHVNHFTDMHEVGDALLEQGFQHPVMDMEAITMTYRDVRTLMSDLKSLGAHNVTRGRPHGLTGKGRLRAMTEAYEQFRLDGLLPASYEVIYGHGWRGGEVTASRGIPLEHLQARLPSRRERESR